MHSTRHPVSIEVASGGLAITLDVFTSPGRDPKLMARLDSPYHFTTVIGRITVDGGIRPTDVLLGHIERGGRHA